MGLADLELDNTVEFIKSHSCSGRMERRFSERLGEEFQTYQNLLTTVFEVSDISYISVLNQKFGFLEIDSEKAKEMLAYEMFCGEISSDEITFIYHVCNKNDYKYMIISWDNKDKNLLYPKCRLYVRKHDKFNILS